MKVIKTLSNSARVYSCILIRTHDFIYFYKNGLLHNEVGPAILYYIKNVKIAYYFLNGQHYSSISTMKEWKAFVKAESLKIFK